MVSISVSLSVRSAATDCCAVGLAAAMLDLAIHQEQEENRQHGIQSP